MKMSAVRIAILAAVAAAGMAGAALAVGRLTPKNSGVTVRTVSAAETGKEAVCPVTGERFRTTAETPAADYRGEAYYFCCPGCDTRFAADPDRYLRHGGHGEHGKMPERGGEPVTVPGSGAGGHRSGTENGTTVAPATPGEATSEGDILYWTCSMHPDVRADKPGKCPVCAMDLVPVHAGAAGTVKLDAGTRESLGMKSVRAECRRLTGTVTLPGRVADDGDLYLLQQEYLSSLKYRDDIGTGESARYARETFAAARLRLERAGYTAPDFRRLEKAGSPDRDLIYPGGKVWMIADVYEQDFGLVRPGQGVTARVPAYPGKTFTGTVRQVEPTLDPDTRSARARIEFPNPEGVLKLEMFADLAVEVEAGSGLAVPENAVIDTGTRTVVYVDNGDGTYAMRAVTTGRAAGGYVLVASGLKEGEFVVTDGNFLLDSQSTLSGGQSLLYGNAAAGEGSAPSSAGDGAGHRH